MKIRIYRWLVAACSVLLLAGCANFSKDGGFTAVQDLVKANSDQEIQKISNENAQAVKHKMDEILTKPLQVNDAVTVAVLNNKGLQATYYNLGIAEADLVQAGRLKNPTLSFNYLTQGSGIEFDRGIVFSLIDAITLPQRTDIEKKRFEETKIQVASEALTLIDDTRHAYYTAVAAQESINYHQQVKMAADASNELAIGMVTAGNWSALDQANMQSFVLEADAELVKAKNDYNQAREKLIRLLGLNNQDNLILPRKLADLPKSPQTLKNAEEQAMTTRLDLLLAKQRLITLAAELGLTKQTRMINALDVGYENNNFTQEPTEKGFNLSFEIPLFDTGEARVAKADALYQQAVNQIAQMAIDARSEVREAYATYHSTYLIAKNYHDKVIPLQKKISDEKMLRYNGMLISVFDLLDDSKTQTQRVDEALNAKRDYWLANTTLHMALVGTRATESVTANTER